jgi:succinyldiaminopimelate transaminase
VVLVWLNSPGNPHGRVLTDDSLRAWVAWGRAHGVPVVADECYVTLGWDVEPRSLLHPAVAGQDHSGLLAVHSLSKQSNAAGYRGGLLSGDPVLVRRVWEVRRHLGLLVPDPVQAAMVAALDDDTHVDAQRERYRARRELLAPAVRAAGARIEHSEAGLYLWVTRGEDCWTTVDWLAGLGIVAAPGSFYGPAGARHVRLALTATDERIAAAVERLGAR